MNLIVRSVVASALAAVNGLACASVTEPENSDVPKLLEAAHCIACHEPSRMRVGPPWVAIAARYQGADPEQAEALAAKIRLGGSGNWGTVPMVANPAVTPTQARAIVDWLRKLDLRQLTQAPDKP